MSKRYKQRPSDIIYIHNEYAAYCFDEACIFLLNALESGKELKFENNGDKPKKHYKSLSEFYKSLEVSVDGL